MSRYRALHENIAAIRGYLALEHFDWIAAVDSFASAILKEMVDFSQTDLIGFARRSVQEARFK